MTAIAQAQVNDQPNDQATQQEQAENWHHYNQSTRTPPAELEPRMQAEAAQRALSERWTYYYHATRMSPAELRAWMQAVDLADNPTAPPAEVPTLVRPAEPSGPTGWVSLSLGVLAALVAGLTALAVRRVSRRVRAGHAA